MAILQKKISSHSPIVSDLMTAFNIPKDVRSFKIIAEVNALVVVECEFHPDRPEDPPVFKRFTLVEIEEES